MNIHAHPKEGQREFQGGGGFKSHFFEQKYDTKMTFLGGGGFNLKKKTFHGRGMDIFWNNTFEEELLIVIFKCHN